MDKEAVGMERDWHAMMAAFDLCPHDMSTPDRMRWIAAEFRRRADGAQQPAAQAAGLTDEGIIDIAELDGVATYETGWYRMTRSGLLAFARALLSRAASSGEPVAYVECRECGRCGHTGINDAHSQDECCSNCDWTGPAPKEDVCPGCAQTGTMRAACPKCGSVYRLLCETTVGAATKPSAQQAEPGSPMKAAADALRRKAELEQAHQDGYRDGFKAAQAMLDKAEQPAEEARGVAETLRSMAATAPAYEAETLEKAASLLAAPAAGTGQDAGAGVSNDYQRGYEDGQKDAQAATGAKGLTREDILRIGKEHFRYGVLTDDAAVDFAGAVLAASKEA